VDLPPPPPGDDELRRAQYQALLDDALAARAHQRSERAAEKERDWQRVKITLDSEQTLRHDVHLARVETVKAAISRTRSAADFVRNASTALITLYTGVIGATFAVTKQPLPSRGLVPVLFLAVAIVLAAAYTAFATRARGVPVPTLPTNLLEREVQRLNAFVSSANDIVVRRLYCLHGSVISLGFGAVLLPTPFLGWSNTVVWLLAAVGMAFTLVTPRYSTKRARGE
jgi:formate-dependent nitrite reductase membrane component NrfD